MIAATSPATEARTGQGEESATVPGAVFLTARAVAHRQHFQLIDRCADAVENQARIAGWGEPAHMLPPQVASFGVAQLEREGFLYGRLNPLRTLRLRGYR